MYELGKYKERAINSQRAIFELNSYEDNLLFWEDAISNLYNGLEESIKFNVTSEKEKDIKIEFITIYYYNLYINLPKAYLEEEFINEINSLGYYEREEKIKQIAKEYIPSKKYIQQLSIQEPLESFKEKLFDSNFEFHYPKIEYRDKNNKSIKNDYLTNLYK